MHRATDPESDAKIPQRPVVYKAALATKAPQRCRRVPPPPQFHEHRDGSTVHDTRRLVQVHRYPRAVPSPASRNRAADSPLRLVHFSNFRGVKVWNHPGTQEPSALGPRTAPITRSGYGTALWCLPGT